MWDREGARQHSEGCAWPSMHRRAEKGRALLVFSSVNLTHFSHFPVWARFFYLYAFSYPEITEKYLSGIVTEEKKNCSFSIFCHYQRQHEDYCTSKNIFQGAETSVGLTRHHWKQERIYVSVITNVKQNSKSCENSRRFWTARFFAQLCTSDFDK